MIKIANADRIPFRTLSRLHAAFGLTGLACSFFAVTAVYAQFKPPKMLSVAAAAPKSVKAGKIFTVSVTVTIDRPYHIQANPTKEGFIPTELTLGKSKGFKLGKVSYPKSIQAEIAGETLPVYEDKIEIKAEVASDKTVKPGVVSLPFALKYQGCNDKACFPPGSVAIPIPLSVLTKSSSALSKPSGNR